MEQEGRGVGRASTHTNNTDFIEEKRNYFTATTVQIVMKVSFKLCIQSS